LTTREFRALVARWRLGVPLDPVQIAVDALLGGLDSRSLRLLAGERSGAPYLAPLFEKAAEELGFGGMDVETATFILTRDIAVRIVSGELTELEGGERISKEVYRQRPSVGCRTTCTPS